MTPAEAAAHLVKIGCRLGPGAALGGVIGDFVDGEFGAASVSMHGNFAADDLDAIATWLRSPSFVAMEIEKAQ